VCADPGTGVHVCQFLSGCRPIGEICRGNNECCSNQCALDGSSGVRRCANPPGCLDQGEVCSMGGSSNCCPGGGRGICSGTIAGVERCYGTSTTCRANGSTCAFGDQCCGGICTFDSMGVLRCGSSCIADGNGCTANGDCCSGNCNDGTCSPAIVSCGPITATCTLNTDCCSNNCVAGHCN
jgi:hypothetical protein